MAVVMAMTVWLVQTLEEACARRMCCSLVDNVST